MKVSELNQSIIAEYCRLSEEDLNPTEIMHLEAMKAAAVHFCCGYTGLTEEQLDKHEDITVAVMVLVADMYDNRQMYVDKNNTNKVADAILSMHCVNWIPGEVVPDVN